MDTTPAGTISANSNIGTSLPNFFCMAERVLLQDKAVCSQCESFDGGKSGRTFLPTGVVSGRNIQHCVHFLRIIVTDLQHQFVSAHTCARGHGNAHQGELGDKHLSHTFKKASLFPMN